jgi:hypothetical protein
VAGKGPPPKDSDRRARGDRGRSTKLVFVPGKQPALPSRMPLGFAWPRRTREWWKMWAKSELAKTFTANDWSELLDTAVLHGAYWSGDIKAAAELRLRVAKFGATPEDRARLRIQFADADERDGGQPKASGPAKKRYGKLTVVADPDPEAVGE